jgi:membrane protein
LQAGLADDLADILAFGTGLPGHGTGLAALMSVVSARMRTRSLAPGERTCDDATMALPEWRFARPRALSSEEVAMRQRRNGRVRRQMRQVQDRAVHRPVRGARQLRHDLQFKDLYRSGKEFELMERAMGFAALAMLTVFPLLVVVAAASAASRHGLARWVVYGMGLTGSSARAVVQLFAAPGRVLGTTSFFSLLLVAVFGVTFAGSVQAGFERVWGLPAGPWHKIWRQAVWLIVLIVYIYAAATVAPLTHHAPAATVSRVSVAIVLGIAFFWWGLRFLVGGRVSYLAAMPGAVATVAFLAGLRAFSALASSRSSSATRSPTARWAPC